MRFPIPSHFFNWKHAGCVNSIDFTASWWVTTCNLRKSALKYQKSETISRNMISLPLDPSSSNIQVTTGLNTYTIIHVWVWENFFPCLRSSELLMTTIFSTTKKSLQLLQSSLSDGNVNWFPKVLLISLSVILSHKLCFSPTVLNFFTLCVAWKGMEEPGQQGLHGYVGIKLVRHKLRWWNFNYSKSLLFSKGKQILCW